MNINKDQTLNDFLKMMTDIKSPKYVYVNNNFYSYYDLDYCIDVGYTRIKELNQKIVFIGDSWYIKDWCLKYNLSQKNRKPSQVTSYFDKRTIKNFFENDIPDSLIFCENCEILITEDELKELHLRKRRNYHLDEDDQQVLCEECLDRQKQMSEHPGSFLGLDDEDYNDFLEAYDFDND
jgi:hypothetical protein